MTFPQPWRPDRPGGGNSQLLQPLPGVRPTGVPPSPERVRILHLNPGKQAMTEQADP